MKRIKYKTNKQVTSIEFSVDKNGYDFLFGLCEIFDLKDIFIDVYTAVTKEQDYKALSKVDNILIATADRNAKTKDIHLKTTTENLLQITAIAILAEAVWENLKMIWQDGKVSIDRIGALIVSIVISMATQLDVFAILNFGISIPFVGSFLTGILISRGANFIHDLLNKIQTISNS